MIDCKLLLMNLVCASRSGGSVAPLGTVPLSGLRGRCSVGFDLDSYTSESLRQSTAHCFNGAKPYK